MIVAIDGPAGSGKSTAARLLAERLGFDFLDTGAMYRAVALRCIESSIDVNDADAVAAVARGMKIDALGPIVLADGRDVTQKIRAPEVSNVASRVAAIPAVREAMVALQRQAAEGRQIVTEGRDQGTVVFPQAECKFYITAAPAERARRRQLELAEQGEDVSYDALLKEIEERDNRDRTREAAPLRQADDALRVDTSAMSSADVLAHLERIVRQRMQHPR